MEELRWSDAAMRLTSCSRRESYGRVSGGCSIRSRTSVAYSGESDATMYSNFVLCAVIPRVENWASTCANQTSGSDGQYGGSLRLSAATPLGVGSARGSTAIAVGQSVSRVGLCRTSWSPLMGAPVTRKQTIIHIHITLILLSRAVECS